MERGPGHVILGDAPAVGAAVLVEALVPPLQHPVVEAGSAEGGEDAPCEVSGRLGLVLDGEGVGQHVVASGTPCKAVFVPGHPVGHGLVALGKGGELLKTGPRLVVAPRPTQGLAPAHARLHIVGDGGLVAVLGQLCQCLLSCHGSRGKGVTDGELLEHLHRVGRSSLRFRQGDRQSDLLLAGRVRVALQVALVAGLGACTRSVCGPCIADEEQALVGLGAMRPGLSVGRALLHRYGVTAPEVVDSCLVPGPVGCQWAIRATDSVEVRAGEVPVLHLHVGEPEEEVAGGTTSTPWWPPILEPGAQGLDDAGRVALVPARACQGQWVLGRCFHSPWRYLRCLRKDHPSGGHCRAVGGPLHGGGFGSMGDGHAQQQHPGGGAVHGYLPSSTSLSGPAVVPSSR